MLKSLINILLKTKVFYNHIKLFSYNNYFVAQRNTNKGTGNAILQIEIKID